MRHSSHIKSFLCSYLTSRVRDNSHRNHGFYTHLQHRVFLHGSDPQEEKQCNVGINKDDKDEESMNGTSEFLKDRMINKLLLDQIKVPRNQSILPSLLRWIEMGNELGQHQMKAIFTRLEVEKKYAQALEVSEWLLKEKPIQLVETHYARWLYYVGKVHGPEKAEASFALLPSKFQGEVLYCRLFDVYLDHRKVEKALHIIDIMKVHNLHLPVYIFNNLITFYEKNNLQSRIPELLKTMEKENVAFNVYTYNILLAWSVRNLDMENLEKHWANMLRDDSVKPDFVSYSTLASAYLFSGQHEKAISSLRVAENHLLGRSLTPKRLMNLISLYGWLKQGQDVNRVYKKLREMPGQRSIPSYVCTIEAYGEVGLFENAECVAMEMELQRGWHHLAQYNSLLGVYCKQGKMEKAEEVLKKSLAFGHRPDTITYTYLLLGYLKANDLEKAMLNLDSIVDAIKGIKFNWEAFVSNEWLHTAKSVIDVLAMRGDKKHAELLMDELEAVEFHLFLPRAYRIIEKAYATSFGNRCRESNTKSKVKQEISEG